MDDDREARSNFLGVFLTLLLSVALATMIFAMCGGISIGMAAVVATVAAIGAIHYFFWGRSLDQAVVGEREEQELRELMEADNARDELAGPESEP
jgi:hypothetical protein